MTKGKEDQRQFHVLRKTIDQADLPVRAALIKLARNSDPSQLKAVEHSIFQTMQSMLNERGKGSSVRDRKISCLKLPEEIEDKLLRKGIETLGTLCSMREDDLENLDDGKLFSPREIAKIRAQLGEVGLTFEGEVGPFAAKKPQ